MGKRAKPFPVETEEETNARLSNAARILHEVMKPRGPVVRRQEKETKERG